MCQEKLFLVNPFDKSQMTRLSEFEEENEINSTTTEFLKSITSSTTEKEYLEQKRISNCIEESLFIEENKRVTDSCHIHAEKDIKSCNITFAPIKTKLRNRRLLTLATDFAIHSLGMFIVFITIETDDKNMVENLEARGFENLGEESGKIIYLKEKEELLDKELVI